MPNRYKCRDCGNVLHKHEICHECGGSDLDPITNVLEDDCDDYEEISTKSGCIKELLFLAFLVSLIVICYKCFN